MLQTKKKHERTILYHDIQNEFLLISGSQGICSWQQLVGHKKSSSLVVAILSDDCALETTVSHQIGEHKSQKKGLFLFTAGTGLSSTMAVNKLRVDWHSE